MTIARAQSVDKVVFASAGRPMENSDIAIDFTMGEPIVGLAANNETIDKAMESPDKKNALFKVKILGHRRGL